MYVFYLFNPNNENVLICHLSDVDLRLSCHTDTYWAWYDKREFFQGNKNIFPAVCVQYMTTACRNTGPTVRVKYFDLIYFNKLTFAFSF